MCCPNRCYEARCGWMWLGDGGRWLPVRLPFGFLYHTIDPTLISAAVCYVCQSVGAWRSEHMSAACRAGVASSGRSRPLRPAGPLAQQRVAEECHVLIQMPFRAVRAAGHRAGPGWRRGRRPGRPASRSPEARSSRTRSCWTAVAGLARTWRMNPLVACALSGRSRAMARSSSYWAALIGRARSRSG